MKPAGKIKLKATGVNRYAGGDSKWHTVTGYSIEEHAYADPDDAYGSIFMMFTWEGKENNRGVCVKITEEHSDNLVFKDCNSGKSLTAKQAVDIILGNTKPKQPRENKNGRHNDKKTDRRKVQKVRTVRDRVKRDSKLV